MLVFESVMLRVSSPEVLQSSSPQVSEPRRARGSKRNRVLCCREEAVGKCFGEDIARSSVVHTTH